MFSTEIVYQGRTLLNDMNLLFLGDSVILCWDAIVPKSPLNSSHRAQWTPEQGLEPSGTEADSLKKLDAALPFSEPLTSTRVLEYPSSSALDSSQIIKLFFFFLGEHETFLFWLLGVIFPSHCACVHISWTFRGDCRPHALAVCLSPSEWVSFSVGKWGPRSKKSEGSELVS